MKRMVLGFAFNPIDNTVLLMRKKRPDWQRGKLNGVGGHVESCDVGWEDSMTTMVREFREETGATVIGLCWDRVGRMEHQPWPPNEPGAEPWQVDVFMTQMVQQCHEVNLHQTDEPLTWVKVESLTALAAAGACLENIPVLVALCLLPPAAPSNRRPDFVLRY